MLTVTREQVLRFRVRHQQLDQAPESRPVDSADVLDLGVQDTGTGGAAWSLTIRGATVAANPNGWPEQLALAWSVRGAPHAYRRTDLPAVEQAVRPWSDRDAGKRIFDANKPLKAAGIGALDALRTVAEQMRDIVEQPTVKGAMSSQLTERLPEPYLRWCRPCQSTHVYEMPFRLAALQAGLELDAGTSPPVLRRTPGWPAQPITDVPARLDPVRAYLHHLGPAGPAEVAGYLDAPLAEVRAHWPDDVRGVQVEGSPEHRWVLAEDGDALRGGPDAELLVRLLGPFDLYLQGRDRELLVPDPARRKDLWRTLGRPGAILVDGDIVGTWRPRAAGRRLRLEIAPWHPWDADVEAAVDRESRRLAEHRGLELVPS